MTLEKNSMAKDVTQSEEWKLISDGGLAQSMAFSLERARLRTPAHSNRAGGSKLSNGDLDRASL